jgi:hypothetical protein
MDKMIDVDVDPVVGIKKSLYMRPGAFDRIRMSASTLINETDHVIRYWYVAMIDVTPVHVIVHKVFCRFLLETTPKESASRHHKFARQHRNPFTTVGVTQLLAPKKCKVCGLVGWLEDGGVADFIICVHG